MPETIAVAAERGLDLEEHAATPLTPDQIEDADLVLGLTQEHRDEVVLMVPSARAKAFTLKELATLLRMLDAAPSGLDREAALARIAEADALRDAVDAPMLDLDVADPLGFGPDFHRAVAWEIEEAVDVLVARLFGPADRVRAAGE
jgi:protein-tyrosine-phosphatase